MQKKKAVIGGVAAAAVVVGLGSWWAVGNAVEDVLELGREQRAVALGYRLLAWCDCLPHVGETR